jgi:hypothetical protein
MAWWNPASYPAHFVSGLGKVGSELFSDDPARKSMYGGEVPDIGIPGYGDRAGRLLEGRRDYSEFRGQQQDQINRLLQMSREGDPLARQRLQQQAEANAARANAQALSMGPGNAALGARMAMQQGSAGRRDAAGQGAMADTAARLGATQQLTGALQGMRQQDQALMMGMSQLEMQQALAQGQLGLGREQIRAQRYGMDLGVPSKGEQYRGALTGLLGLGGILGGK